MNGLRKICSVGGDGEGRGSASLRVRFVVVVLATVEVGLRFRLLLVDESVFSLAVWPTSALIGVEFSTREETTVRARVQSCAR